MSEGARIVAEAKFVFTYILHLKFRLWMITFFINIVCVVNDVIIINIYTPIVVS